MPNTSSTGRRAGPAPRKEPVYPGPSPFSSVLAEYMWQSRDSRNRPLGVGQLAIKLGVPRPTLNTWVHRNVVPDLEIVLAVLRTLNIPVERLFAYYGAAGLPVPPLTDAEAQQRAAQTTGGDQPAAREPARMSAPAPQQQPLPASPATATPSTDPWEAMIANTADSLRQYGVPEAAIAATLANIRATQAGQPHAFARHVAAEHAEPQEPDQGESPRQQRPHASRQ